jgi:predicted TIM-barrel enzyme
MMTTPSVIRIVSTWPPRAGFAPDSEWIFCPWAHGLPQSTSLWIASLPIHDSNAVLLDAISSVEFRDASSKPTFAGVWMVDPFRRPERLFRAVADAGISGVVNLPTVGVFGGATARALDGLGTSVGREITMLAEARGQGLRIGGVATTSEVAGEMINVGCEFVVLLKRGTEFF